MPAARWRAPSAARFRPCRTLVLAGPGNNGGDGYVAARLLQQAGWPVARGRARPAARGFRRRRLPRRIGAARRCRSPPAEAARAELVIDAVFGAGLARDVDGIVADALRAARRVVAVDVPSGVDGGTGAVRGYAPQAALTVSSSGSSPGICCCPAASCAAKRCSLISACPTAVLRRCATRPASPTCRSCGTCRRPGRSRTSIRAAMSPWWAARR